MPTLVIHSIHVYKYDIKCLNNLMVLSIYQEEVDNLDKYIVNKFIKKVGGESNTGI